MNDSDRRRYEMLVRVKQFGIDNAADFTGIATTKFAEIGSNVDQTEAKSAAQQAGFGETAQQFEVKDTARENLRDEMSAIARTARSMEYSFDGISEQFRFQRNLSDEIMLARARAFATAAVARQADFIAYGLSATFNAAANAFEATFASAASATAEQVAATAETAAFIREGMIAKRVLDGIVRNRYADDPGKLAAWLSASHVEKAPKSPPPATTPITP